MSEDMHDPDSVVERFYNVAPPLLLRRLDAVGLAVLDAEFAQKAGALVCAEITLRRLRREVAEAEAARDRLVEGLIHTSGDR